MLLVLHRPPFETVQDLPLVLLIYKVVITSARRMSELAVLSCKKPFLVFYHGRVVSSISAVILAEGSFFFSSKPGHCFVFTGPSHQEIEPCTL